MFPLLFTAMPSRPWDFTLDQYYQIMSFYSPWTPRRSDPSGQKLWGRCRQGWKSGFGCCPSPPQRWTLLRLLPHLCLEKKVNNWSDKNRSDEICWKKTNLGNLNCPSSVPSDPKVVRTLPFTSKIWIDKIKLIKSEFLVLPEVCGCLSQKRWHDLCCWRQYSADAQAGPACCPSSQTWRQKCRRFGKPGREKSALARC